MAAAYDPRVPGAGALQDRYRTVAAPVARRLWRIEVSGLEHLPTDGPAILCPNHISFLDSAFLMLVVPRRISFVGKAEYMSSWKTRYVFPALGMIPIDRSGGSRSGAALEAAREVLERGELFGIFPEGTRSRDGKLYKGHTGASRLALEVGCPILPVGVTGTADIQPPNAKLPKLGGRARIDIGRPVRIDRNRDRGDQRMATRSIIDEVMFEIRSMTGQTYVDRYAGKKPTDSVEGVPAAPAVVPTADHPSVPDLAPVG